MTISSSSPSEGKGLDSILEKSRFGFFSRLSRVLVGKSSIDVELLDGLEEVLISSDVGIDTTLKIVDNISKRVKREKYLSIDQLDEMIKQEIVSLFSETSDCDMDLIISSGRKPYVFLVVGVNGVGKTTTIGKLASRFKKKGWSVMLGAADTFRVAAIDQLKVWADRVEVPMLCQQIGSDPASVVFDTLKSAVSKNIDVVIIDTAGRLHNKVHLMKELSRIKNVIQKVVPSAHHEVLLVLDGSTGQNAFEQVKQFTLATDVNALAITKLDGTSKGGVVIGISDRFKIPVKYIGIGEKIEDLQEFNKFEFVNSFFTKKD